MQSVRFGKDEVVVTVRPRTRVHRCPQCRFATGARYDRHRQRWRHIALGRWVVWIEAEVSRLDCPRHGVLTETVAWAAQDSRFTLDFEDLVAWLAREMNQTAVTRLLHVAWKTVGRIIQRVVGRASNQDRLNELYRIGLDEVSYRKGHKYLSVIANHQTGEPAWIGEGRSSKTLGAFFDELGPERSEKLEVVTMDMCGAYIGEVQRRAPNAAIAFDPFHVIKLANEALHQLRRTESREWKGSDEASVLKGARWTLLKAPEDLLPHERVRLAQVAQINTRVYRGYLLKEELRALYWCSARTAPSHLAAWIAWARRSRLRPFVNLARTLDRYREGIVAAIRFGLSNGRMEGLNNKIGVLKHRAYGFHSAAALIAMIFLCCTHLHLELPI